MTRVAAILGPILLLAVALAVLARPADDAGVVGPGGKVLDDIVADAGHIDVALLGNSKAGTDLDPPKIAALFPDAPSVVTLRVNGTGMPVWYAVLAHRVYDHGQSPRLVIVYGTLAMMLQVDLPSEEQRRVLGEQLAQPDPVLDAKVFGKTWSDPRLQRALNRRTDLRHTLTDGWRNLVVGALLAPPGPGTVPERGRAYAEAALGKVFGVDVAQDLDRTRVGPIVERDTDAPARVLGSVDETLLPDFLALAQAHGAKVVFVRAPLGTAKRHTDVVDPALRDATIRLLGEHGAAWIDLTEADLPDNTFGDGAHMSRAGRQRFTPLLLDALRAVGVGSDALTAAQAPVEHAPLRATRTGTPPTLPAADPKRGKAPCDWVTFVNGLAGISDTALKAAGYGEVSPLLLFEDGAPLPAHAPVKDYTQRCGGASYHYQNVVKFAPTGGAPESVADHHYTLGLSPDVPLVGGAFAKAWWVYPGTTLTLEAGEPLHGEVVVGGYAAVPGVSPATVTVGGVTQALAEAGAELEATVPGAGTSVVVASPADGPWLLVRRVSADGDYLVGKAASAARVSFLSVVPTFAGPPPAAPVPDGPPKEAAWKKGSWLYFFTGTDVPALDEAFSAAGAQCTPMRVTVDGQPVESTFGPDGKTPVTKATWAAGHLTLVNADGSDPRQNGHTYAFRLEPERLCTRQGRWVYPGDVETWHLDADALGALRVAAGSLQLTGAAFPQGKGRGTLRAQLRAGGAVVAEATWPLADWTNATLPLPTPLPRDAQDVELVLSTAPGDSYVLVSSAELVETNGGFVRP